MAGAYGQKVEDKRRDLRGEMIVDPGDAPFPARTAAFIPPEIADAGTALQGKLGQGWSVSPGLPVTLASGQVLAPDWQCVDASDKAVHVEVFHRWHVGPLRRRLQQIKDGAVPQPWILAIDRGLLKKKDHRDLADDPLIANEALLFSSMPTANMLAKAILARL